MLQSLIYLMRLLINALIFIRLWLPIKSDIKLIENRSKINCVLCSENESRYQTCLI